jgi:hypothetical protein
MESLDLRLDRIVTVDCGLALESMVSCDSQVWIVEWRAKDAWKQPSLMEPGKLVIHSIRGGL